MHTGTCTECGSPCERCVRLWRAEYLCRKLHARLETHRTQRLSKKAKGYGKRGARTRNSPQGRILRGLGK